jgi:hypothetical protein
VTTSASVGEGAHEHLGPAFGPSESTSAHDSESAGETGRAERQPSKDSRTDDRAKSHFQYCEFFSRFTATNCPNVEEYLADDRAPSYAFVRMGKGLLRTVLAECEV